MTPLPMHVSVHDFGPTFGSLTIAIVGTRQGPAIARIDFGTDDEQLASRVRVEKGAIDHAIDRSSLEEYAEMVGARLAAYFAGAGLETDDLELMMVGEPFTQRVWKEMRAIRLGHTLTYGELARKIGSPTAARAVGNACRTNPIPIIVPCHRVLDSAGRLHGYAGGLALKATLLELEGTPAAEPALF